MGSKFPGFKYQPKSAESVIGVLASAESSNFDAGCFRELVDYLYFLFFPLYSFLLHETGTWGRQFIWA